MRKGQRLMTSLLISAQLLMVASPVVAQETVGDDDIGVGQEVIVINEIPEEAFTEGFIEEFMTYIEDETYSEGLTERLDELLEATKTIDSRGNLLDNINLFTRIHEEIDTEDAAHYYADVELLGWSTSYDVHSNLLKAINSGKHKELLIRYVNQIVIGYTEGATGFRLLIDDVVEHNEITSADDELARIQALLQFYTEQRLNGTDIELSIKDGKLFSPEESKIPKGDLTPDEEGNVGETLSPPGSNTDGLDVDIRYDNPAVKEGSLSDNLSDFGDRTGTYYEFDEARGRRIRVDYVIRHVDGRDVRSETRTVEASGLTSLWSDRYESLIGNSQLITDLDAELGQGGSYEEREDVVEIRMTLQYTLNKNDQYPIYVDTGVFTDEDERISYDSLYNVLFQIATNIDNGYLVEDSDKLLIVIEGRPTYIVESDATYSKEEVEQIFEDFEQVNLIVAETRIGTTHTLEWQIKTGHAQSVLIDGEEVELVSKPEVRGERVVLPIIEILEMIGATVRHEDGVITAEYGDDVITFEVGVSEARINGELVDLEVPVEDNVHGEFTAFLTPVFNELNIDTIWDEEESMLILENTRRAEVIVPTEEVEEIEPEEE